VVLAEGKLEDLAPPAPVAEGAELQVELLEVDRHDGAAGVGKVEGFSICVGAAAELVGKRVKIRIERVLDGVAYATLVRKAGKPVPEPLTAEAEAEKPTRKPPARKTAVAGEVEDDGAEEPEEPEAADEPLAAEAEEATDGAAPAPAKKKTRRGSRGGKNRKKTASTSSGAEAEAETEPEPEPEPAPVDEAPAPRSVTIHVPGEDLGRDGDAAEEAVPAAADENGDTPAAAPAKKKTRRGSRGGKNRRKRTAAAAN